jgi:hypothetical protein
MSNRKPYRTKAQKALARATARKDADGAWRSEAPFCLHGEPGEWVWDASHKAAVRSAAQPQSFGGDTLKKRFGRGR